MAEEKRSVSFSDGGRPAKRPKYPAKVSVSLVSEPDSVKPLVASCPGSRLPPELAFKPYVRSNSGHQPELLLHSTDHSTVDFTAVESRTTNSSERYLRHYVGIFDPATARLTVVPAKKMTIRSEVRQAHETNQEDEEEANVLPPPSQSARAALTEAFGSKKSKKNVQSMTENRLLASGTDEQNPLSKVIFSNLPGDMQETSDTSAPSQTIKPLPPANIDATEIRDVYPLSSLVFPEPATATLSAMPISKWLQAISNREGVETRWRYVAHRVEWVAKPHIDDPEDPQAKTTLQLLRYVALLLEIHKYVASLHPRKTMPNIADWPPKTISGAIPSPLLIKLMQSFFPDRRPTPFALTLLRTTILALTLHIPPAGRFPANPTDTLLTDPSALCLDLALERPEANKLLKELGCKIKPPTDTELHRWGLAKVMPRPPAAPEGDRSKAPKPTVAKLEFPLEFPQVGRGRAATTRGRR